MREEWMPGAEIRQGHGGGDMVGGVAKALHHITWDSLHSDGTRIVSASGIADYLIGKGYEPHFVIDPFTGQTIQLMAASRGASALAHPSGAPQTNNSGTCNIQVEWLFTPGTVYEGTEYGSLIDTPMLGLEQFLAFTDSWGVPRVAPEPDGGRDVDTWQNVAGHYGHFNAPNNDHTDPQCSIQRILDHSVVVIKPQEDEMAFRYVKNDHVWVTDGMNRRLVMDPRMNDALHSAGVKMKDHPDVDGLHAALYDIDGGMTWLGGAAGWIYLDHQSIEAAKEAAVKTEALRLANAFTVK